MVEQPSGAVTLVFTDIEGSTRLLHQLGQETYAVALAVHRRIVREACARHSGYEVDYEGDSFFYAFSSAAAAVSAVSEAMAGLERGPIRIRVGIHTGAPGLDPPKYVGMDVHLAARVMSVGHGRQVLLSKATRDSVDLELKDLGEHRLKDILDPVWLYQLGKAEFPPLRSLNNTNLPTPASSFLGRERELEQAEALLTQSRLVTVSGPGGAGKTRFAIELASRQLARFPNGVFWIPLAGLRDPTLVTQAVAQTLGASNGLAQHIGERRMLLLLDNLEQVIEASPELAELTSTCQNLSLLVTSRELMLVNGEIEFALPPLAEGEAVELFCERAHRAPAPAIGQLCERLDGLPLAIELAAARMSVFTPTQLLDRLGERLDLLRGGRDADPRQRTLRATIEWSYELLTPEEATLFRRLAVFAGGSTLEAAEEVARAAADTLQSLVEKSLVRHTGDRFWMLETIREFGLEKLAREGEANEARGAYSSWVLRFAQGAGRGLDGSNQTEWLERLHNEHPNIREAVSMALAAKDGNLALGILTALDRYWWVQPGEAMAWFENALDLRDGVSPALVADALRVAATTAWFFGQAQLTHDRCSEALAIFKQLGDELGLAKVQIRMAPPLMVEGRLDDADRLLTDVVAVFRRLGDERELRFALAVVGYLKDEQGDLTAAAKLYEESTALSRKAGDLQWAQAGLSALAQLKIKRNRLDDGVGLIREALVIQWAQRDLIHVASSLAILAGAWGAKGATRHAAIFWGAAERLDNELGSSQFRAEKPWYEAALAPAALSDEEGIAIGKALPIAEAVDFALGARGLPS